MPGQVNLQTTINSTAVQVRDTTQLVYILIDVKPSATSVATPMPLNFGLVLDRSGSMAGTKIANLREAVKLILNNMNPQDQVSIIVFDDKVDTLVSRQPVTDLPRLHAQVDRISDRGGTEMSRGIRRGLDEIRSGAAPDRLSRMLLLTDGETWGDEEQCKQLALECGNAGIAISAFGLGDDWNSELLDAIAQNSGGTSDYLDTPDKIMVEFQRTLQSMKETVATNAQLTMRFVPGVTPRAAWRVVPQITPLNARSLSERDVQVHLGDLERGSGQSVLVELLLQPKAAGTYRIAQADIAYDIPAAGIVGEHARQDIVLTYTDNPAQIPPLNPQIMNLVEKVTVFKLQTRALNEAQAGNIGAATQQLRAAATRLLNLGEAELAQAAEQEAANLESNRQMTSAGTKKLQYGTRKLTQRLDDTLPG